MPPETRTTHKRGSWSTQEDQRLLELVEDSKSVRWVNIAEMLGTRTSKQCRERYHQNLKPSLNHNPITPEEGKQIDQLVSVYGKRWAEISRHLKGRSDNAIKNWWNASANRRRQSWRPPNTQNPVQGPHPQSPSVSSQSNMPPSAGLLPPSLIERRHSLQPGFPRAHSISGPVLGGPPPSLTGHSQGPPLMNHTPGQPPLPPHLSAQNPPQVGVVFNPSYSEDRAIPPATAAAAPGSAPGTGPSPSAAVTPHTHQQHLSGAPYPSHAQHLMSHHHHTPYSRLPVIEPYLEDRWRSLRKQSYDSTVDLSRYSLSVSSHPSSPESRRSSYAPLWPSEDTIKTRSELPGERRPSLR